MVAMVVLLLLALFNERALCGDGSGGGPLRLTGPSASALEVGGTFFPPVGGGGSGIGVPRSDCAPSLRGLWLSFANEDEEEAERR